MFTDSKIKTPIQKIISQMEVLVKGEFSTGEYQKSLQELLQWLGAIDIYAPINVKLQLDPTLDAPTRAFLELEFLPKAQNEDVFIKQTSPNEIPLRESIQLPVSSLHPNYSIMFENLDSIRFDIFGHSSELLMKAVLVIFEQSGVIEAFEIDREKLWNFVQQVAAMYKGDNPYHNFVHAFDVLQFAFVCLQSAKTRVLLTDHDVLSLLIAALVHDVAHPGVTNSFLTAIEDDLAIVYNGNFVVFFTLTKHRCQCVGKFPLQQGISTIEAARMQFSRKIDQTSNQASQRCHYCHGSSNRHVTAL